MRYTNPNIESFYRDDDLGRIYYDIVLKYKPKKIVELGTFYGYSTVAMAMALDELTSGKIVSYDLYEEYPYRHPTFTQTKRNIETSGVAQYIELRKKDFYAWIKDPEAFDLLYVDVSNTGEIIEKMYAAVRPQIQNGSIVIFEGGSPKRDAADWMTTYHMKKITDAAVPYTLIYENPPSAHNPFFALSMITNE